MKIVFASTPEQKGMLSDLISHMYTSVFPRYLNDQEIIEFHHLKILQHSDPMDESMDTLDESFKAIASIQTIIAILEMPAEQTLYSTYVDLFDKNVKTLERCGLFFPFTYKYFFERRKTKSEPIFSAFSKSSNELLI